MADNAIASAAERSTMRKKEPPNRRFIRGAILGLVLVCVALAVHEIYGDYGYLAFRRQKREYNVLQQEVRRLQEENQQLERRIGALKSDPKTIESIARGELHMARPGELIYTLPEKSKDPKPQDPSTADNTKPNP